MVFKKKKKILDRLSFYNKNGYLVIKIFTKKEIDNFENLIKKKSEKYIDVDKWHLSNYHKIVDEDKHNKIIKNSSRCISVSKKIIDKIRKHKKIISVLESRWGHSKFLIPDLEYLNGIKKTTTLNKIKKNEILFRIVVPKKIHYSLSAPPHLDLNAGKIINRKKEGSMPISFSLWTPIIGFSKKYTLNFAPGSHLVNHPLGKITNQKKYISRTFESSYYNKFKFKRLDLKKGEAILFDINLLHGGADNLGDKTRVSLETRMYHHKKIKLI